MFHETGSRAQISPTDYVTRGTEEGCPVLAYVSGARRLTVPLAAVGAAIAGGVISAAETAELAAYLAAFPS